MSMQIPKPQKEQLISSIRKRASMFTGMLPILAGVVLLTGLILELIPTDKAASWFGRNNLLDALIGTAVGSISAGHPLTSYVLGGELLANGISLGRLRYMGRAVTDRWRRWSGTSWLQEML